MNITLTTSGVLIGCTILTLIVLGTIYALKKYFETIGPQSNKKSNISPIHTYPARSKHSPINIFQYRGTVLRFSLVTALAFAHICLSWTLYDTDFNPSYIPTDIEDIIETLPPRTPPPIKPPPPPEIVEIPEEDLIESEQPELKDMSIDDESTLPEVTPPPPKPTKQDKVPLPPPPPVEPEIKDIFKIVEDMPRFPGCEGLEGNKADKKACSDKKLLEYLYKHLKYPSIARENRVEGRVYIQFVIEKDGSVSNGKIIRDIGAGCGLAALKVVNDMNSLHSKWTPGSQRGNAVRVLYTLPVSFKLQH